MTPSLPLPLATDAMVEPSASISPSEFNILQALSTAPLHLDVIAARAGQRAETTSAALLTLALEDVVVEGPPGFFRRRDSHNH
jgi:DNA processing protein